jgi:hypothetical protein
MRGSSLIMEVTNLAHAAQLASVVIDLRNYFKEQDLPQPPLPENLLSFIPCNIRVTEGDGEGGVRLGKVLITNPKGNTLYETEWRIASPEHDGP